MEGIVYKITNTRDGNKCYIGKTRTKYGDTDWNEIKRFNSHLRLAFRATDSSSKFQKNLRQFGEDSYIVSVLHRCDIEKVDELESDEIYKHDSTNPECGYNIVQPIKYHSTEPNICYFCKNEFKFLASHNSTPPKYCALIREPLRCKDGCNAIITHEPLEIHIQHCNSYIETQQQNELTRLLELDKKSYQENFEQQNQELSQAITQLEKDNQRMKYDFEHTISITQLELAVLKETSSRTIIDLKQVNAHLQDKLASATSYHSKEYNFLTKRYEMLEMSYKSIATICANKSMNKY